jgi:hypothetical protein
MSKTGGSVSGFTLCPGYPRFVGAAALSPRAPLLAADFAEFLPTRCSSPACGIKSMKKDNSLLTRFGKIHIVPPAIQRITSNRKTT